MELKKIKSFQVDHTKLEKGMYISRIDGDVVTYDIRMKKPNAGLYLANAPLHTIEHLFATYVRSSEKSDNIIYFGPMGCRTGFYLLTRGLSHQEVIDLTLETFRYISSYEGPIPGYSAVECGNYLDHDLPGAREEAKIFIPVMEQVTENSLVYRV